MSPTTPTPPPPTDADPKPAAPTVPATVPAAPKVPAAIGLVPSTVDEAWRLASLMAKSDIVPKSYKGKPEDVLVAIMYGAEVGLTPAQAITGIAVINGRPGLFGEALLAVIMASPLYGDHEEYYTVDGVRRDVVTSEDLTKPTTAAVCTFARRGAPAPVTRQFSVADAIRARLVGKAGPWIEYPQIMLRMRARGFAARDAFPDVLRGVRTAEELQDTPAAPVLDHAPVVRRRSDTPATDAPRVLDPARVMTVDGDGVMLSTGLRVTVHDAGMVNILRRAMEDDQAVVVTVHRTHGGALDVVDVTITE